MKYMGSKRSMLRNGLGEVLAAEAKMTTRVVDLFCGAGSVSWFAATELGKVVRACDLQQYAVTLVNAVVRRTSATDARELEKTWLSRARRSRARLAGWRDARKLDTGGHATPTWRRKAQTLCAGTVSESSVVARRYGGHYFSPTQALALDAMRRSLPEKRGQRDLCLAATIMAASQCVAAPGHTAQPFKATKGGSKYLVEAWNRDPFRYAKEALTTLCTLHSVHLGHATVWDANRMADWVTDDDLVFVDPPYSDVQYSRFYHVLETIARGSCSAVDGIGRYPPQCERPVSAYSRKTESMAALRRLFAKLAKKGCKVVVTFPDAECSNGLSGSDIARVAAQLFRVRRHSIRTRFSTLGGTLKSRGGRFEGSELILILEAD